MLPDLEFAKKDDSNNNNKASQTRTVQERVTVALYLHIITGLVKRLVHVSYRVAIWVGGTLQAKAGLVSRRGLLASFAHGRLGCFGCHAGSYVSNTKDVPTSMACLCTLFGAP